MHNITNAIIRNPISYIKALVKWLTIAVTVGVMGGLTGALFHKILDIVTEYRIHHSHILYFLPLGGIAIAAMYRLFRSKGKIDTNRIIRAVSEDGDVPFVIVPLIFLGTVITHLFGGSAGREGAALQIGGGIGYNFGKLLKLNSDDMHIITMAGTSSVFAALFGTPVTAAIFSLEVISVGAMNFTGFMPCIVSASSAYYIASLAGISPMRFDGVMFYNLSAGVIAKVIILAIACAILSIIFCLAIRKSEHLAKKIYPNRYFRAFFGGLIVVLVTLALGTYDYNGAGVDVITRAVAGNARSYDFIIKLALTAITISSGFKGGEIIPSLFIGSTFGCVMASLLGIDPGFCAAIGMIALFCGVVNCPIASIFLSAELFGASGLVYFGIACAVSYIMSGYSGLYKSQTIVYSKLTAVHDDAGIK